MSDDLSVEDLDDLFDNAPCGYVVIAKNGRIAKINRTLAEWLEHSVDDLIAMPFNQVLSFGGKVAFETHLTPMLRLQGRVGEIALDLLTANRAKVPVIANASEKRGRDGEHLLTRLTVFKAIERRSYERSLVAAKAEAEAATLAEHETAVLREQFIAVLGHDLRNPVAAIDAGTRLLGREELSERGSFILTQMGQSVARASTLIDNVLDFARGRLGEGLILDRNANEALTPVLEQVVAEVQAVVPERTITSNFQLNEPIDCDRQRIGQLTANLLSNAVAHGAPDAPIEVEASSTDLFRLSVTNRGDAIPSEALDKLFEPFFRGGTRRSQQGLGLGLFIVSEIARAHSGSMEVVSNDDGTTFTLTMPLTQ